MQGLFSNGKLKTLTSMTIFPTSLLAGLLIQAISIIFPHLTHKETDSKIFKNLCKRFIQIIKIQNK